MQIADKNDKHPAVIALAWGLKHGTSVIPKVRLDISIVTVALRTTYAW